MEEIRRNPEELLKQIQREEQEKGRGRLKIFFGYAAGVGKTYAMLEAAHEAAKQGIDVVAGYVEPHARPETEKLLEGLEILPNQEIIRGRIVLHEFDLDGAMKREPQLILVDELAHTNADGCRHKKRYQDVKELINNGIDVYTTVNVQHIESLNDLVASITGIIVKERVPDSLFDHADQVKLVDIEPKELMERLNEGKVYQKNQAEWAIENFFTVGNLEALREIALRRCADRVNIISEQTGGKSRHGADEHILVCLSSSPTNAKIIRNAARMASSFKANFTALFVETPHFSSMSEENKKRLRENIHLAQQLGASIETVFGEDIAFQISEFARLSGVSKIVLGRSNSRRSFFFQKPPLTEKIIQFAPDLDIYIIPDQNTQSYQAWEKVSKKPEPVMKDLIISGLILAAATGIGSLFDKVGFSEANIITIYILGVLITSVLTSQRLYSLISSVISVLLFNFCFTDPRLSLDTYDTGYPVTFIIMFLAAFMTSSLAVRIKRQARQAAATAYRTKILFDTNQLLSSERDFEGIINVTCTQLKKLLNRDILFYRVDQEKLLLPTLFSVSADQRIEEYTDEKEQAVAVWVYKNNKHAGATTHTLGNSKCLYLSVRVSDNVYGVVGIAIDHIPLEAFENSIMLSILGECALALQNQQISMEREAAALFAKNEQMRANMLRSISHDLRTPLTSISGNAGILLSDEDNIRKEKRVQLYADIYEDSLWLINLVENLLSVTRIEDGTMKLNMTTELLDEVIEEALKHTDYRRKEHNIRVKSWDTFVLVKIDARLIMQVIINLVDNAVKYTPKGSDITIETKLKDQEVIVTVSDNGEGISDEAKKHIFEMFYTADSKIADSRRSLGLGLALCKSIITAHHGTIWVSDGKPQGTVFTFTLPGEEVILHE